MHVSTQLETVQRLKEILVLYATGDRTDTRDEYKELRKAVMADVYLKSRIPKFVKDCADLGEFWSFIKPTATYAARRDYLRTEFRPVIAELEDRSLNPSSANITESLAKVDWEHVQDAWRKALERKHEDPEGAVTAARSLVETVCKHILDAKSIAYSDEADLPALYNATAKALSLAPSQQTEPMIRQLMSGCYSIVNGMAGLRNKISDAHGKGLGARAPDSRHAEFAVNVGGALASFLVETFEAEQL